ncbi:MAG: hypothetical protein ACHQIM_01385 [Sphingobacteriales bacterium]
MKKSVLAISTTFIILVSVACNQKGKQTGNPADSAKANAGVLAAPPPNSFTLNAIPGDTADAMVKKFTLDPGHYDPDHHTCIWFSKAALRQMDSVLNTTANSDGIRFYFARELSGGSYTTVAVSTLDGGVNPGDSTKHIHKDYFQTSNPSGGIPMAGKLGDTTPAQGALLYSPHSPCKTADTCKEKAQHYISCSKAYRMVYTNCKPSDSINAKAEWFDKGVIKDLITAIPNGGGLRLYFAKHSEAAAGDKVPRTAFVLMVTQSVNGIQTDEFVCLPIHPIYKQHHLLGGGGTDNGEMCPVNCTGVTLP